MAEPSTNQNDQQSNSNSNSNQTDDNKSINNDIDDQENDDQDNDQDIQIKDKHSSKHHRKHRDGSLSRHRSHHDSSSSRHRSRRRDHDRGRERYHRRRSRSRSNSHSRLRSSSHRHRHRDRSSSYDRDYKDRHHSSRHRGRHHRRHKDRHRDRSRRKRSLSSSKRDKQTDDNDNTNNDDKMNVDDQNDDQNTNNNNTAQSTTPPVQAQSSSSGPLMKISVTVYPKSTPGSSSTMNLNISHTQTVSDFKSLLSSKGFNVYEQYNLFVGNKKLESVDDKLLCVHAGIKADTSDVITVKPINNNNNKDAYNPYLAANNSNNNNKTNKNNVDKVDQIEMYKAYVEMFGVEEAAAMMGLNASEVKKVGIESIFQKMEEEKEKKRLDAQMNEAAVFAASTMSNNTLSTMNTFNKLKLNQTQNSNNPRELLFQQAIEAASLGNCEVFNQFLKESTNPIVASQTSVHGSTYNGIPTNENLIDFDKAPGTTHTAGGGTISRPPPSYVSENSCIFVGDLHPMVTRSDLLSVFNSVGDVLWIQLFDCHKQMNRPFNFSFIYFDNIISAQKAITTLNYTKFYNSPCRLMWKQEKNSVQWTDCNIIIKNLPPNTDSQLLHNVFSKYGKILSSKVKTTSTGRTLPYGYVQYETKKGADLAIIASSKNELSVMGHQLTAEWFKSREDRAFRQIYVKNIPTSWTDDELLHLFEAQTLGKIKSFTVKHSPYGRWACISFEQPHHAVKAINKLNGCPTGDLLLPQLSVSRFMYKTERDKFKISQTTTTNNINNLQLSAIQTNNIQQQQQQNILTQTHHNHQSSASSSSLPTIDQCYSIYIGNIPLQLTDEHLKQLFEPFGAVISCAVVQKTEDYKYGFVNFEQPEDAARALITMNGKCIGNKTLQVKPANTDMSKAIAISQASINNQHSIQQQLLLQQQQMYKQQQQQLLKLQQPNSTQQSNNTQQQQQSQTQSLTKEEAKNILRKGCKTNYEKIWKVQYGEDWHEYDNTLAAIVEQLNINEQIQITLADSNYIITRINDKQAIQQNCASGTKRKVLRSERQIS